MTTNMTNTSKPLKLTKSGRPDKRQNLPGRFKAIPRPDGTEIARIASIVVPRFGVSGKGRDVMLYVFAVSLDFGNSVTSEVMQVSRELVGLACGRVEDRRDDPVFDAALSEIETLVTQNTPGY